MYARNDQQKPGYSGPKTLVRIIGLNLRFQDLGLYANILDAHQEPWQIGTLYSSIQPADFILHVFFFQNKQHVGAGWWGHGWWGNSGGILGKYVGFWHVSSLSSWFSVSCVHTVHKKWCAIGWICAKYTSLEPVKQRDHPIYICSPSSCGSTQCAQDICFCIQRLFLSLTW